MMKARYLSIIKFSNLFTSSHISHRQSCSYAPEPMGYVERKHRHLVETNLALLASSFVPKNYKVEAFHTAIYFISKLLNKVLKHLSPHEKFCFLKFLVAHVATRPN